MTLFSTLQGSIPTFRRSWRGYNTTEVDRFLKETATERERFQDALTRVETLIAEWQDGPEAIVAAAHREAGEIRASADRQARRLIREAERREDLESLNALPREVPIARLSPPRNVRGFLSDDRISETTELQPRGEIAAARVPAWEIGPLHRNRSERRHRMYRIVGLAAACGSLLAVLTLESRNQATVIAPSNVIAQTVGAALPEPGPMATSTPTKNDSIDVAATIETTGAPAPSAVSVVPVDSLTLTLSAVKPCWISTVIDGTQRMDRLLRPDETLVLHALDEALLKVGDAAALSLLINNRPARTLGGSGEVVTRLITRANYSSLLQAEF